MLQQALFKENKKSSRFQHAVVEFTKSETAKLLQIMEQLTMFREELRDKLRNREGLYSSSNSLISLSCCMVITRITLKI